VIRHVAKIFAEGRENAAAGQVSMCLAVWRDRALTFHQVQPLIRSAGAGDRQHLCSQRSVDPIACVPVPGRG
jgi:hypothetical protein